MSETEAPQASPVELTSADDKLRHLVAMCQKVSGIAPKPDVPLVEDLPSELLPEDPEAVGDLHYDLGWFHAAEEIRRALRAIGVEPAEGHADWYHAPEARARIREFDGEEAGQSTPAPKAQKAKRLLVIPANGLVPRAVVAAKLGVSRERVRQLIKEGKITETPNGIDLAKALGEFLLNVDQSRVAADRSRADRRRRGPRPAPIA